MALRRKTVIVPIDQPLPADTKRCVFVHEARPLVNVGRVVHPVTGEVELVEHHKRAFAGTAEPRSVGRAKHDPGHLLGRYEYVAGLKPRAGSNTRRFDKRSGKFIGPPRVVIGKTVI